jgi:hypothetical protein
LFILKENCFLRIETIQIHIEEIILCYLVGSQFREVFLWGFFCKPLSSSAIQLWVGRCLLKQISPVTSIVGVPANFYNPVSLHLPLPRQSILMSVCHVLIDLQGLSTVFFLGNLFSSIRATWHAHLSVLNFIT